MVLIVLVRLDRSYAYKVFSPGHVNGKGQPDDFVVYCSTLTEARAIQAVRDHVAAKPARKPSGKWNGPPTPWLTNLPPNLPPTPLNPPETNPPNLPPTPPKETHFDDL